MNVYRASGDGIGQLYEVLSFINVIYRRRMARKNVIFKITFFLLIQCFNSVKRPK